MIHSFFPKITSTFLIMVVVVCTILFSNIIPILSIQQKLPGAVAYGFFKSHPEDYFQYVSMIRQGKEHNSLLFTNQYDSTQLRTYFIQPFYNIVGVVTQFLPFDQFQIYFLIRMISALLFYLVFLELVFKVLSQNRQRLFAILLFSTITAFSVASVCEGIACRMDPQTYAGAYFNAWLRLLILPPHHYLALLLVMKFLIRIPNLNISYRSLLITILMSVVLGLLHPYIASSFFSIFFITVFVKSIAKRAFLKELTVHLFILGFIVALLAVYTKIQTRYELGSVFRYVQYEYVIEYIKALGTGSLLLVLSMFFIRKIVKLPHGIPMVVWAIFPGLAILTPIIRTLLGEYRIFQIMQHIPISILGGFVLDYIIKKFKIIGIITTTGLFLVILYILAPVYLIHWKYMTNPGSVEFFQYKIFSIVKSMVPSLNMTGPAYKVVLSGDMVSAMLPALGPYRVVNARIGNTPDLEQSLVDVQQFYYGLPEQQLIRFFNTYHPSSALFGIDTVTFSTSQYTHSPYFTETARMGEISLVEINR